ncbi:MAG: type IV secretory system conjugative DNA transfer family protein [Terracidiphilus sp.]
MKRFLEHFVASFWNRLLGRRHARQDSGGMVTLGSQVVDDEVSRRPIGLSPTRRAMHIAFLGKTGTGKSSLLKNLCVQDIEAGRGFVYFDLHGDATPFLLRAIAAREWKQQTHLSDRLLVISPADREMSVGLNPLEDAKLDFVRIAEFAEVLKQRWGLDHFGARTDELLRNALYVLAANGFTLLELAPLLTHPGFRATCLKAVPNAEVRHYFESRYGQVSEPMRAVMREPILNKTSAFTADPRFRHIVGQTQSTFSMREAMDEGHWVIVDLPKGSLGEQALTLGSLLFTVIKNALFTRTRKSLFTVYCDEIQNLIAYSSDVETVLSEARKFGVSVVSANQFLDQYPAPMRAAILSIGTHVFFQLSSVDAVTIAQALDGGKSLAERLKNLPQRHFILKSGADHWVEGRVPMVADSGTNFTDLLNRSRALRAHPRALIEREITKRHAALTRTTDEVLHDWD